MELLLRNKYDCGNISAKFDGVSTVANHMCGSPRLVHLCNMYCMHFVGLLVMVLSSYRTSIPLSL